MWVNIVEIWNCIWLTVDFQLCLKGFFPYHFSFQLIRFKQNVVQHDITTEVICPPGTAYLQYDHDTATIDGKNTHHGLGSIAIANGKFSNFDTRRTPLPRDKKTTLVWHAVYYIYLDKKIIMHQTNQHFSQVVLCPVVKEQFKASLVFSLELLSCISWKADKLVRLHEC